MKFKNIFILLSILTILITGCSKEEEPDNDIITETRSEIESLTLIYAVASNNLESFLRLDTLEMVKAAETIDLGKNAVVLYSITRGKNPTLKQLKKVGNDFHFVTVKDYDNSKYSTDPVRINEVISDVLDRYKASSNGIIFWSHAFGWTFSGKDHIKPTSPRSGVIHYSFGQDNTDGTDDRCDIDELAEAVPEGVFDYIWFDCCYMGSIEVAFEMKDKAPYFIGYPTEIGAEGMPYDITLPFLARLKPELVKAAEGLYQYYNDKIPVTIAIYDTGKLDILARSYGFGADIRISSFSGIHNYGRLSYGPFYDLGQLAEAQYDSNSNIFSLEDFKTALNDAVIYKAASLYDFSNKPIDPYRYSGLSVHYILDDGSPASEFYKSLKWYKATHDVTNGGSSHVPPLLFPFETN